MIESWLVRRMLSRLIPQRITTSKFPRSSRVLRRTQEHADDIILETSYTSGIGLISVWPNDDDVQQVVRNRYQYGYISQGRIVMILAAIEESLYSTKVDILQVPKGLSIEHIMPQKWADHWPLPAHLDADDLEAATEV